MTAHDAAAETAAMRIAEAKWGGRISVQGSSEFRERMARRVSSRGIQYLTHRRKGERLARTWPGVIAAQAAVQRLMRGARVVV